MVAGEKSLRSFVRGVLVAVFLALCFWLALVLVVSDK